MIKTAAVKLGKNKKGQLSMKKIVFLFPGQGAQKVGMGQDVFQEFKPARHLFLMAEELTGLPIRSLCFNGPKCELSKTIHLQPALTTVNLALLTCILTSDIRPTICAGHSLGEYSALAAAGIISIQNCIRLVQKRGELMQRESLRNQGTMSAILGPDVQTVSDIVASVKGFGPVSIANHNSADQIVITGTPAGVERVSKRVVKEGAHSIPLPVNGAWHSPLINGALSEFETFLSAIEFKTPVCKLFHNVTAAPEVRPEAIRALMGRQFCMRVEWFKTMINMMAEAVDVYVEIGPGKILTGLLKKMLPKPLPCTVYNVSDVPTLNRFLAAEA